MGANIPRLLAVCFSLDMGRELRVKRNWDRACYERVEKQTADSSVFFGDNNSCQLKII